MKQQTNVGVITDSSNVDITTQPLGDCLKSTSQFWDTVYTNVCTGEVSTVANGFWDVLGFSILCAFGIAVIIVFLKLVFSDY